MNKNMETLDGSICEQTRSKETSNLCHKEGFTKTQEKLTIHSFKKKNKISKQILINILRD